MRILPIPLATHVAGSVTTLARCWRLTLRDGAAVGFTDHDRDLSFEGVLFRASSGLSPSDTEGQIGLGIAGGEVSGALADASITEERIAAGLYDDAEIATFLVNWADVSQRLLLDVANIGEIRRADGYFVAELRSIAHRYDQPQGRLYQTACAADLGDARCGLDLTAHRVAGFASPDADALTLLVPALAEWPGGWADGGRINFTAGANAGTSRMIREHAAEGVIRLWEPLPRPCQIADPVEVTAGCDKTFATCAAKFANTVNFRGFPHIPTPDFILSYARQGEGGHDGGLLDP